MSHDASKVVMGSPSNTHKVVDSKKGSVAAGLPCYLKSDNTVTSAASDGELIGISLGKDLSDTNKTAICRAGIKVPVIRTAGNTPAIGAQVYLDNAAGTANSSNASSTGINAVFAAGALTGIGENGSESTATLIDFVGGL